MADGAPLRSLHPFPRDPEYSFPLTKEANSAKGRAALPVEQPTHSLSQGFTNKLTFTLCWFTFEFFTAQSQEPTVGHDPLVPTPPAGLHHINGT